MTLYQYLFFTSVVVCIMYQIQGANVLIIAPLPVLSHSVLFLELAKGLAKRGHQVDVYSYFPINNSVEGYNDIILETGADLFPDGVTFDLIQKLKGKFPLSIMIDVGIANCKLLFKSKKLRLLKNSTKKYDLFITELWTSDCLLGWGWHFGVPTIVATSNVPLPFNTEKYGLPDNPAYVPTYFMGQTSRMSFCERIVNTFIYLRDKIMYKYFSVGPSDILARKFFGNKMPYLEELAYNTNLLFVNTHFSIHDARPFVPNIIEIAGLHIQNPKPLNQHFDTVLNTSLQGVIYFSVGGLTKIESFPSNVLQDIFNAFSNLPYKILWKARKEKLPHGLKFPSNIYFEAWIPQMDILCDPRVKLFVTHGGMMGMQEAVYCGVPILGIPLFADQMWNTKHAEALGYGLSIHDFSKDSILFAARKILQEPKFAQNAKKVSKEFRDRPMSPLDTAVYWTEYVIRHKGAPRLQSAAKYLSWYQYYLIDVIVVTIILPCILLLMFGLWVYSQMQYWCKRNKVKLN